MMVILLIFIFNPNFRFYQYIVTALVTENNMRCEQKNHKNFSWGNHKKFEKYSIGKGILCTSVKLYTVVKY